MELKHLRAKIQRVERCGPKLSADLAGRGQGNSGADSPRSCLRVRALVFEPRASTPVTGSMVPVPSPLVTVVASGGSGQVSVTPAVTSLPSSDNTPHAHCSDVVASPVSTTRLPATGPVHPLPLAPTVPAVSMTSDVPCMSRALFPTTEDPVFEQPTPTTGECAPIGFASAANAATSTSWTMPAGVPRVAQHVSVAVARTTPIAISGVVPVPATGSAGVISPVAMGVTPVSMSVVTTETK